jgi:hypothetical protein
MDKLEQIVQLRKLVTQYEQGRVTATDVMGRTLDILSPTMFDEAEMVMPEIPATLH